MTTCPLICVASEADCPTSCPTDMILCLDGTCSNSLCDDRIESLCGDCSIMNFTCPKVNNFLDTCHELYETEYTSHADCIEAEVESIPKVSFLGPFYRLCYYWISFMTVIVFMWCLYNQKINPVMDAIAATPISNDANTKESSKERDESIEWSQIGYKTHWLGLTISILVWATLLGIQVLLVMLTVSYYIQVEAISWWKPLFEGGEYAEPDLLKTFELVWAVGFVWSLSLQWPESIESIFLRRCTMSQATHVAVVAPIKKYKITGTNRTHSWGSIFVKIVWFSFDQIFRFYFSYPTANCDFETIYCRVEASRSSTFFYCRMGRYIYNDETDKYVPASMKVGITFDDFLSQRSGLTSDEANRRFQRMGPNTITLVKPTLLGSFVKEFSKTFYVYQNFIIWSWYPYWFYYMAITNTFVRVGAGTLVAVFQYISDSVLYKLSVVEGSVDVIRDGAKISVSIIDLVPGDVVILKPGNVYCDMVVLKSDHLIVDEGALTGEATPLWKAELCMALKDTTYDEHKHKSNTVFAGTCIVETSDKDDLGLVIATGSFTTKGKFLCDILSYNRHKFLFDDEVMLVLTLLAIQAIVCISLVLYWLKEELPYAVLYALFILSTIIPPLLPTVFVVSVGVSSNQLQRKRISCVNPEAVLVAGKVNVCCFDKTGTLTETSMAFVGIQCNGDKELENLTRVGMSVCHSLKLSCKSEITGNHIDKEVFNASGGTIDRHKGKNVVVIYQGECYTILKQFEFDNHRQTQSVLVETNAGRKLVFVKGSPEVIRSLCRRESVPETFEETLRTGSKSGSYQIAIAHKSFDLDINVDGISRGEIESSLSFGGFISFQNHLKQDAPLVISELKGGNILVTMLTGDNVLTGIYVARQAGLCYNETFILGKLGAKKTIEWSNVDTDESMDKPIMVSNCCDLAMTGEAWALLVDQDIDYALSIVKYVRVFGRCSPSDKVSVINTLVRLGYVTLMCGDGQNDCGALKSAHVGVALSTSDASIVATFTSLDLAISSVAEVLREGRCALSSALKAYSYYLIYGQVETYLQMIAIYLYVTYSEWSWVFMDGIWSSTMAFSLPLAGAAAKLSPCRPTASLLSPRTLYSVVGMLAINFVFIVIALVALNLQEWYPCRKWELDAIGSFTVISDNYEAATLFVVGGYQYISSAIALNFGYTFRASWYRNYVFVALALLWSIFQYTMTLHPSRFSCIWRVNCSNENVVRGVLTRGPLPISNSFNTTLIPESFRWILAILMTLNLLALCAWEYFFVNKYLYKVNSFGKDDPFKPTKSNQYLSVNEHEKLRQSETESKETIDVF